MNSKKIERTFVRQEAYRKLKDGILNGTLAPGDKLKDQEIAERFGVSRTPIREALLRLEEEGLVQTKPNCFTHVSHIDFEDAKNLYSIVCHLEKLALSQAFESIDESHIEAMTVCNEQFLECLESKERLEVLRADYLFHLVYIRLAGNSELERIIDQTKVKLERIDLYYFSEIEGAKASYNEHKNIIESIRDRDLIRSCELIDENWNNWFLKLKEKRCLKKN